MTDAERAAILKELNRLNRATNACTDQAQCDSLERRIVELEAKLGPVVQQR